MNAQFELFVKVGEWITPILSLLWDNATIAERDSTIEKSTIMNLYNFPKSVVETTIKQVPMNEEIGNKPDGIIGPLEKFNELAFLIRQKAKEVEAFQAEEKVRKTKEYWEAHAEEKTELENQIQVLDAQLAKANEAIKQSQAKQSELEH